MLYALTFYMVENYIKINSCKKNHWFSEIQTLWVKAHIVVKYNKSLLNNFDIYHTM